MKLKVLTFGSAVIQQQHTQWSTAVDCFNDAARRFTHLYFGGWQHRELLLTFELLSETKSELEAGAKSHGWDLSGIDVLELIAGEHSVIATALRHDPFMPSNARSIASLSISFGLVAIP